jgi:hypothetical protein
MYFLIFLALIGCFVVFPRFRKSITIAIASFLFLAVIGFVVIYGSLFIISAIPTGKGNFVFWLFFVVIGFIVLYALVHRKKNGKDFHPNLHSENEVKVERIYIPPVDSSEKTIINCGVCNQKLRVPVGREIEIKCPNCGTSRVIKS